MIDERGVVSAEAAARGASESHPLRRATERKPRRRNETRELTEPIRAELNAMIGVRLWRNNTGFAHAPNGGAVRYGLATGSADLVGVVDCGYYPDRYMGERAKPMGRFFALEVKWPGSRPTRDQIAWLQTIRDLGGFATVVRSIDDARAAVARCRLGMSE